MSLTRIGSIGINTGIAFAGVTTIVTLNTANDALSIGATVNVGSGITLGASGDIFATGVSTFSGNVKVGTGITLSPDGHVFHTGVVTATTFSGALAASNLTGALPAISGANLTNLDASDLASGTVPTARLGSGTASSSTFLRGDSTFQTVNTDLVSDTSPQLGGNLATNSNDILFADNDSAKFGAGTDLEIYHDPSNNNSYIKETGTGSLVINADDFYVQLPDGTNLMRVGENDTVDLFHSGTLKFQTSSTGATLSGNLSIDANIIHNGDTDTMLSFSAANQADIACGGTVIGRFTTDGLALGNNKQLDILDASGHRSGVINNSDSGANALRISADPDNSGSGSHIGFHVDGSEQARIGNGISFNGDTATANFLNDYEEGTWTPVPEFGGSLTGASYSIANCFYTKIGRSVTIKGNINFSSRGSSNGDFKITGVPFNDDFSGSYSHSTGAVIVFFGPNTDGTMNCFTSGTQLRFRMHNEAHANAEPQEADFDNDTKIMFSVTYFTNS